MYALIKDGFVVNVILADLDFITSFEHDYDYVIGCSSGVGIGYTWSEADGFQPPNS